MIETGKGLRKIADILGDPAEADEIDRLAVIVLEALGPIDMDPGQALERRVAVGSDKAYRVDPDDFSYESYDGLNFPYTYSDMTGGQINNVNCNPEG